MTEPTVANGATESPETRESIAARASATRQPIPLRARLSLLRQRAILTVRWWFRLPIDEIKERHTQAQIDALSGIIQQQVEAINTMVNVLNGLTARLALYEREIPRMRELRRGFDLEQAGIRAKKTNGDAHNGILTMPSKIIHP